LIARRFAPLTFELANYARFLTPFFGGALAFSLYISALAGAVVICIAFPFTYFLTRMRRRAQVLFLVFILAVLSLSEVIIGFSWSTLLSRTAGISNLLYFAGLMSEPVSWTPGFEALLVGLCYLGFPYAVLVLYPALSRLDPELPEAARMLGASPARTFFTVVVPVLRNSIVGAMIMVFVFNLGAFLLPQVLGRPQHWTLSVLITDQAIFQSNIPFAAAMAIFLMLMSLFLVGITLLLGQRRATT
jgi:putative spermidine/putrescine transport system permease protein